MLAQLLDVDCSYAFGVYAAHRVSRCGENKLRHGDVQQAVNSMTYQGLQLAAASFLLLCQKIGLSPKETMGILESEVKK